MRRVNSYGLHRTVNNILCALLRRVLTSNVCHPTAPPQNNLIGTSKTYVRSVVWADTFFRTSGYGRAGEIALHTICRLLANPDLQGR